MRCRSNRHVKLHNIYPGAGDRAAPPAASPENVTPKQDHTSRLPRFRKLPKEVEQRGTHHLCGLNPASKRGVARLSAMLPRLAHFGFLTQKLQKRGFSRISQQLQGVGRRNRSQKKRRELLHACSENELIRAIR